MNISCISVDHNHIVCLRGFCYCELVQIVVCQYHLEENDTIRQLLSREMSILLTDPSMPSATTTHTNTQTLTHTHTKKRGRQTLEVRIDGHHKAMYKLLSELVCDSLVASCDIHEVF